MSLQEGSLLGSLAPLDYADPALWLSLPGVREFPWPGFSEAGSSPAQPLSVPGLTDDLLRTLPSKEPAADVFYVYQTVWSSGGEGTLSPIDDARMRAKAEQSLAMRASAFRPVGRVFAPIYRQLDSAYAFGRYRAGGMEAMLAAFWGQPLRDVAAAFRWYLEHANQGRPFFLVGHSQGAIVLAGLLSLYLAPASVQRSGRESPVDAGRLDQSDQPDPLIENAPNPLDRLVAAYLPGSVLTSGFLAEHPWLHPAQSATDTGVIAVWNTEAPDFVGINPFAMPGSALINPVNWATDETYAPATSSYGGVVATADGQPRRVAALADARINLARGSLVCSSVDPVQFSSQADSSAPFPQGILHTSDIPLYYFDLRANALLRLREWLAETSLRA